MLLTSVFFVLLIELYTRHGERLPAIFDFKARASKYRAAMQPVR